MRRGSRAALHGDCQSCRWPDYPESCILVDVDEERTRGSAKSREAPADRWPEVYARWRATGLGATTEGLERRLILELLGGIDGCRVLDIGCGDGDLALDLWKRRARVVGIDTSAAMIEVARARAREQCADIAFEIGRAEQLPFQAASFDALAAVTILCFVPDATGVFREIARVMRPGGRLVIGELGRWSTWAAARRVRSWFGSRLWREGRFRTARQLRGLAAGAGLEVESVRGAIFYPRCGTLARLMAPADDWFGRRTTIGAAFVALSAVKPG